MESQRLNLIVSVALLGVLNYCLCESKNVVIAGFFSDGSHFLALVPIGKGLVQRGHNVTFLLSDVYHDIAANNPEYKDLFFFEKYHCPGLKEAIAQQDENIKRLSSARTQAETIYAIISTIGDNNRQTCLAIFRDKELMGRLQTYDAIVVDVVWPCGVYVKSFLAKHKNTALRSIVVATMTSYPYVQQVAGSPVNPAFQPAQMSTFTSSMTFVQRVMNTFSYMMADVFAYFIASRPYFDIVDEYDLDPQMKRSLHNYIDLYLINVDFAVEFPYPLTPNIIPVGGLTSRPAEPLTGDLENFMQSSGDNGVIIFSLGSTFTSLTRSNPAFIQVFIDVLSHFPQKVLFHMKDPLPDFQLKDNIKVMSWLPMQDVLGHPKTRLFVYHGGNNGFLEAVYHGVPLVVVPIMGDQIDVGVRVSAMGLGTTIDKTRLTADHVHHQVAQVLENPEYSKNAKRLSAIFKDRPLAPADRAAFWIEHVMKHGGDYMRSPAHELSFIQYNLIDVMLFFLLILLTLTYVLYRLTKMCLHFCVRRGSKTSKGKLD